MNFLFSNVLPKDSWFKLFVISFALTIFSFPLYIMAKKSYESLKKKYKIKKEWTNFIKSFLAFSFCFSWFILIASFILRSDLSRDTSCEFFDKENLVELFWDILSLIISVSCTGILSFAYSRLITVFLFLSVAAVLIYLLRFSLCGIWARISATVSVIISFLFFYYFYSDVIKKYVEKMKKAIRRAFKSWRIIPVFFCSGCVVTIQAFLITRTFGHGMWNLWLLPLILLSDWTYNIVANALTLFTASYYYLCGKDEMKKTIAAMPSATIEDITASSNSEVVTSKGTLAISNRAMTPIESNFTRSLNLVDDCLDTIFFTSFVSSIFSFLFHFNAVASYIGGDWYIPEKISALLDYLGFIFDLREAVTDEMFYRLAVTKLERQKVNSGSLENNADEQTSTSNMHIHPGDFTRQHMYTSPSDFTNHSDLPRLNEFTRSRNDSDPPLADGINLFLSIEATILYFTKFKCLIFRLPMLFAFMGFTKSGRLIKLLSQSKYFHYSQRPLLMIRMLSEKPNLSQFIEMIFFVTITFFLFSMITAYFMNKIHEKKMAKMAKKEIKKNSGLVGMLKNKLSLLFNVGRQESGNGSDRQETPATRERN